MCGRYVLAMRPREVRRYLEESNMPSQEAPDDDAIRETYNFAPGNFGLVYRADVPDRGAGQARGADEADDHAPSSPKGSAAPASQQDPPYMLQTMKWGLIPFWTKRQPDYGSMLRTINCRDDSLAQGGGMWTTMKQKKRCIVIAQGFFEWLKKNNGKERVPHYVKRKDGQLMCFAGLWDCVRYDDAAEKLYTYTIVTTDANAQLRFLHDRMPVILDNGSPELFRWLDSAQTAWSAELQALLRPFAGELECYPVPREVGKVGNDSPSFVVPIDSAENKQNIANFFGNQKKRAAEALNPDETPSAKRPPGDMSPSTAADDAPPPSKAARPASPKPSPQQTPTKPKPKPGARPVRSATKNPSPAKKSPAKAGDGSQRITNFFKT